MTHQPFVPAKFPKLIFSVALFMTLGGKAGAQTSTSENPGSVPSIMTATLRDALDTTVSPCEDFDKFANGGWKAKHAKIKFDAFRHLMRYTDIRLIRILEATKKAAPTTTDPVIRALGNFYASCLAADTIETILPLTPGGVLPDGRQAQCLASTDKLLRPALGQAFVADVMSPEVTAHTNEWLATIPEAIRKQLEQLTWIKDSVKKKALESFSKMTIGVATAPPAVDYSGFTLSPTNYEENKKNIPAFEKARVSRIPKDTSKRSRQPQIPPHHFSAFANPTLNQFFVSTMLFQPPFFDITAEPGENYAALGAVIGHEMWHIMTPHFKWIDTEEGRRRASKVANQYSKFGDSGWSTLNEDLGDLGGVLAVYNAWMQHGRKNQKPMIDGFTPEQRFFLYYARLWRDPYGSSRDNVHSGARARINGVVMQIPAFGKAFGCKEGDPMFLARDFRTNIFE